VLEIWAVHDVGRAINPGIIEGQIQGAIVQGLGYALMEELVWEGGRITNPSMMDYKVPAISDVPSKLHVYILEMPTEQAPFGAKGVAEIALVPVAPALANAVHHALGVRLHKIPATPERMLRAILESDAGDRSSITNPDELSPGRSSELART
jgi:carbon-monoxide dehydrogenase large subunit